MTASPRVLVVDDDGTFVKSLVRAFGLSGVTATGCSEPSAMLRWHARDKFAYDLILLDMRLGPSPDGGQLNALKLLPHLMTYAPSSKVVVFSQEDMTVEEALKCLQRGALTIVPKGSEVGELCRVVEVYQRLGDQRQTREDLIAVLWEDVRDGPDTSGQRLEMLMINLFDSMPTFRVIDNNVKVGNSGSIDVLVENENRHRFWEELDSYHLAIECRDRGRSPTPADFNQLRAVVRASRFCSIGILVSASRLPASFTRHQAEAAKDDGVHLFGLEAEHLEALVATQFDEREEYLRGILERQ